MRFYTQQHKQYCGIDLHARSMYVCILDQAGTKLGHKNVAVTPASVLTGHCPVPRRCGRRGGVCLQLVLAR
jgi:hypothetical protein